MMTTEGNTERARGWRREIEEEAVGFFSGKVEGGRGDGGAGGNGGIGIDAWIV